MFGDGQLSGLPIPPSVPHPDKRIKATCGEFKPQKPGPRRGPPSIPPQPQEEQATHSPLLPLAVQTRLLGATVLKAWLCDKLPLHTLLVVMWLHHS